MSPSEANGPGVSLTFPGLSNGVILLLTLKLQLAAFSQGKTGFVSYESFSFCLSTSRAQVLPANSNSQANILGLTLKDKPHLETELCRLVCLTSHIEGGRKGVREETRQGPPPPDAIGSFSPFSHSVCISVGQVERNMSLRCCQKEPCMCGPVPRFVVLAFQRRGAIMGYGIKFGKTSLLYLEKWLCNRRRQGA